MNANTGLVTRQMKADFEACMSVVMPEEQLSEFKQDLLDVLAEHGQQYAAQWLEGWRKELELNGPTGPTGLEIERRKLA